MHCYLVIYNKKEGSEDYDMDYDMNVIRLDGFKFDECEDSPLLKHNLDVWSISPCGIMPTDKFAIEAVMFDEHDSRNRNKFVVSVSNKRAANWLVKNKYCGPWSF